MEDNLRSPQIRLAIGNIERRAERGDYNKLHNIYVDHGILAELSFKQNQVIYGRRGVGKTHLFYYYRDHLFSTNKTPLLFQIHDCRRIGSGLSLNSSDPAINAAMMYRELLNDIATESFESLSSIESNTSAEQNGGHAILAFQNRITSGSSDRQSFDFRNLGDTLDRFRKYYNAERFIIVLDEWVAIHPDVQPFLAELLKRTFLMRPEFVIKIAAVTYQSKMTAEYKGRTIGLERGADIFGDVNLDTFFVWEEDREGVQLFFGQVLFNHLAESLKWAFEIKSEEKLDTVVKTFFTQDKGFVQLCRAAEGNCRDFLNIFRFAYNEFDRDTGSKKIGIPHIQKASQRWYQEDKLPTIVTEKHLEQFLSYLVQNIIRERRSKTFMVDSRDINHPVLSRLFSARLLHPLRITWSHPDRPGEQYNLVTMDYGCYSSLHGKDDDDFQKVFFFLSDKAKDNKNKIDDLVPLDDKRSIRRIVVARQQLDAFKK